MHNDASGNLASIVWERKRNLKLPSTSENGISAFLLWLDTSLCTMALLLLCCCQAKIYLLFSSNVYITIYSSLYFKLLLFLLYQFSSLPLRTSEDESGNRDREVLGQSLGAAGWMHWAVVGGAASMGKRRPGPISTHREDRREGADLDTRSEKRPNPNVAREKKRDAHKNQHHNIATEWKRRQKGIEVFTPWLSLPQQEIHA